MVAHGAAVVGGIRVAGQAAGLGLAAHREDAVGDAGVMRVGALLALGGRAQDAAIDALGADSEGDIRVRGGDRQVLVSGAGLRPSSGGWERGGCLRSSFRCCVFRSRVHGSGPKLPLLPRVLIPPSS